MTEPELKSRKERIDAKLLARTELEAVVVDLREIVALLEREREGAGK